MCTMYSRTATGHAHSQELKCTSTSQYCVLPQYYLVEVLSTTALLLARLLVFQLVLVLSTSYIILLYTQYLSILRYQVLVLLYNTSRLLHRYIQKYYFSQVVEVEVASSVQYVCSMQYQCISSSISLAPRYATASIATLLYNSL